MILFVTLELSWAELRELEMVEQKGSPNLLEQLSLGEMVKRLVQALVAARIFELVYVWAAMRGPEKVRPKGSAILKALE